LCCKASSELMPSSLHDCIHTCTPETVGTSL
jgi:hypothetical protein